MVLVLIKPVFDLPGELGDLTPTGWGWPLTDDRKYWSGGSASVIHCESKKNKALYLCQ